MKKYIAGFKAEKNIYKLNALYYAVNQNIITNTQENFQRSVLK